MTVYPDRAPELNFRQYLACKILGRLKTYDEERYDIPVCARNKFLARLANTILPGVNVFLWDYLHAILPEESDEDLDRFLLSLEDNLG